MGLDRGRFDTNFQALRMESGRLILPVEMAARIENFRATPEGSLVSVEGPAPYVPDWGEGYPTAYGNMHGIFHGTLEGGASEVLLLASGSNIWSFAGWRAGSAAAVWERIVGLPGSGALTETDIPDNTGPQFPTQFEATGTGFVIVPQGGRAVFYDGTVALPLGYDHSPSPPYGLGPTSSGEDADGNLGGSVNDRSYSVGHIAEARVDPHDDFGNGRLGTTSASIDGTGTSGILDSEYSGAVQWIDYFGNLSPLSGRSNTIELQTRYNSGATTTDVRYRHWAAWRGIELGSTGTIGRIVCRTRDTIHSGTNKLFILPPNVGEGASTSGSFATIPDNSATFLPDNTPDGWLVREPIDVVAVPIFKLCRVAFGRLWIGNTRDDPGLWMYSLPGRWGTFQRGDELFPDPSAGAATGSWMTNRGLLLFTTTSTYLVTPADDSGGGFRSGTFDASKGCVAPSSFANLPDGSSVWLGQDGFYRFDGQTIQLVSGDETELIERLNPGRLMQATAAFDWHSREYRCWLPLDGSRENDLCMVYDGTGWKRRTDASLRAVCVTRDPMRLMLGAGRVTDSVGTTRDGVWAIDRVSRDFMPANRIARIETSWIEGARSRDRKSPKQLFLMLRETGTATANVQLYRDWRQGSQSADPTAGNTKTVPLDPPADRGAIWGTTVFNQAAAPREYVRRRPFWTKEPLFAPDCEVYKIVLTATSPGTRIEFFGLQVQEQPHGGSARVLES